MPGPNTIPHIDTLSNIESHFKVFAGPGAGKTTWLASHLKRVLKESERLGVTRKIACITYTNVAAEEILKKLDSDKSRFEISTIHGFLYHHVVKPFAYLINKGESNMLFNINELSGHEEHIPRLDKINSWITALSAERGRSYRYLTNTSNLPSLIKCLADLDWKLNSSQVELKFRNYPSSEKAREIRLPSTSLLEYKHKYWQSGIMHHEDVLYFSYLIINKSPRVLDFIRSKFPYIFVDEFQDTTELQTWIVKKIAGSVTRVGVIGDLAQSIYKFAGANRSDFESFVLDGLTTYELNINRRSTQNIIIFLNGLRSDIQQGWPEDVSIGSPIKVLVGPITDALQWLNTNGFSQSYILTRRNENVESIRAQSSGVSSDKLKELYSADSNSSRAKALHYLLMGYRVYKKGYPKEGLKEISRSVKKAGGIKSIFLLRRISIKILEILRLEGWRMKSLYDFYMDLLNLLYQDYGIQIGSRLAAGSIKTFYQSITVEEILPHIKVDTKSEDMVRTIHSTKGTEFDNVLVHFETLSDFEQNVLNAKTKITATNDDSRLFYVGLSRAKENLFINVPEIDSSVLIKIHNMNLEAVVL